MNIWLMIILCILVYFIGCVFTLWLSLVIDRIEGYTTEELYQDSKYNDRVMECFLIWWGVLPIYLFCIIHNQIKKWIIFTTEIIVTKRNEKIYGKDVDNQH